MADTKPVPQKPAVTATDTDKEHEAPVSAKHGRLLAVVSAGSSAARDALAAAKGMPGWPAARAVLGAALAAGNSALLFEARGKAVSLRRRVGVAWQEPESLGGDDATATFAALKKLAVSASSGEEEPEFEISARKLAARACRIASRHSAVAEEVLVLVGAERPKEEGSRLGRRLKSALGRLMPSVLKRKPAVHRGRVPPRVTLEPTGADAEGRRAALVEAAGYAPACNVVAAAVQDRVGAIVFEAAAQGVAAHFDIDGVATPAPLSDAAAMKGIVGILQATAGLDPRARGPQSAKIVVLVDGKPWPCTVSGRRGSSGARIELVIEQRRPKFKSLADLGLSAGVAERVEEFLKLESGLMLVVAPRRGGLSTLFDGVLTTADRLLRDFVLLEDAATPQAEIQNVRPVRWDSRTEGKPVAALDAVLREYPNVLATCDLEDKELAQRLVAQAGEGRLVIMGLRGVDAADGIARLGSMGVDPKTLSRVLLGAVGCQLVRKLCPKCRQEYFPAIDMLAKLKIDLGADVTLFRAAATGCAACTGTGYLGRIAACEVATGPTLRAHVAKAADADVLRKAAIKDGMVAIIHDAIAKAARGVTSLDEIQRVFRKG